MRSTLSAELFDLKKPRKPPIIIEMKVWPHADGFVCANCGWPLYYERIEYKNAFFCRSECALKKNDEKGKARLISACSGSPGAGSTE